MKKNRVTSYHVIKHNFVPNRQTADVGLKMKPRRCSNYIYTCIYLLLNLRSPRDYVGSFVRACGTCVR